MTDPAGRRSRIAWPGPMSLAGGGEGHRHDLPDLLLRRVRLLTRALVIVGVCVVVIVTLVMVLIIQRGNQRDEENARLRDLIRQAQCDQLDQLPAGGLLERPRRKYHCGPGIPLSDLTPQEQALIPVPLPPAPPTPPQSTTARPPAPPSAAPTPSPAPTPPSPSPPKPSPAPTPPSPSPVPATVPGLLCGLLPIC